MFSRVFFKIKIFHKINFFNTLFYLFYLDSVVKWEFKLTNNEDDTKFFGPFTSAQMLEKSEQGEFKDTGVWCRKVGDQSTSFYNSKRIDFDLYT